MRGVREALGRDLHSVRLLYFKAALFLVLGLGSSLMLLIITPQLTTVLFLSAAVWGFCRFYYFSFYVIDKYIDPGSRYSSLTSYLTKRFSRNKKP